MEFKEVKDRTEALFSLQKEYEEAKRFSNDIYHEFKRKEAELGAILEEHNLTKIVVENGIFSVIEEDEYSIQDYSEFRQYLYSTGNENLLTVHSRRLKSFLKMEFERGANINGVEKSYSRKTYRLNRGR